jgi:hypothetical protein
MTKPVDHLFPGDKGKYFDAPKESETEGVPQELLDLQQSADEAAASGEVGKCVFCKHGFFWWQGGPALLQGQVYSQEGAKETQISGICEFCFDATMDGDDD